MPRPRSTQLSAAQRRVAQAISALEEGGFSASVAALVRELGLSGRSSVAPTLRIMERNGYLVLSGGGGHGRDQFAKLSPKGRHALGCGGLPVLGTIRAGLLEEAIQEPEAILEDGELLPHRPGDFLLRVRGDSMIGDGILPGDHVLIRPGVDVARGEIAAVMLGREKGTCEATLKRVYFEKDKIRCVASNPAYPDQVLPAEEVAIAGVFRGLIRYAGR